jgi:hypothetical protein
VYLIASLSQTLESFVDWENGEKGRRGKEIYVFEEEESECEKYRRKFFII